jgi:type IV pilus assembly protein PilV
MNKPSHTSKRVRGVTLVETLVAMVILLIGLLGLVGLVLAGVKHNANANMRATAGLFANDILDRLRANPVRAASGAYNIDIGDEVDTGGAAIVVADLTQWRARLQANLSGGTGSVDVDTNGVATIEVRWTEREAGAASGRDVSFQFVSRL